MKNLKIALSDGFEASASMKPLPEIEKDLAACLRVFMLVFPNAPREKLQVTRREGHILIDNGWFDEVFIFDDGSIERGNADYYPTILTEKLTVFSIAELFLELGYWPEI